MVTTAIRPMVFRISDIVPPFLSNKNNNGESRYNGIIVAINQAPSCLFQNEISNTSFIYSIIGSLHRILISANKGMDIIKYGMSTLDNLFKYHNINDLPPPNCYLF